MAHCAARLRLLKVACLRHTHKYMSSDSPYYLSLHEHTIYTRVWDMVAPVSVVEA